jgi:3-hydroxybutyrate dehydrogenase
MREAGASMLVFSMQTCASLAAITAMMDAIEARGGPDILVNNAGIQQTVTLAEVTQEIWDDIGRACRGRSTQRDVRCRK